MAACTIHTQWQWFLYIYTFKHYQVHTHLHTHSNCAVYVTYILYYMAISMHVWPVPYQLGKLILCMRLECMHCVVLAVTL